MRLTRRASVRRARASLTLRIALNTGIPHLDTDVRETARDTTLAEKEFVHGGGVARCARSRQTFTGEADA